jgi:hypothetical protein
MTGAEMTTGGSTSAVRLLEHNLIRIQDLLGASRFAVVERSVEFTVPARSGRPAQRVGGSFGDWLVRDGGSEWRIVPDGGAQDTRHPIESADEPAEVPRPSRRAVPSTS